MKLLETNITAAGDTAAAAACTTTKIATAYTAAIVGIIVFILGLGLIGSFSPSATTKERLSPAALIGVTCVFIVLVLVLAWNILKYRMIDSVCHYTFPNSVGCPKYREAWQNGFRNSKIVTTASHVQMASNGLESSNNAVLSTLGTAADTTASVGGSIASFNLLFNDWNANYYLSKCAIHNTMSKSAFIAMRLAMYWVPITIVSIAMYYGFHQRLANIYATNQAEDDEKEEKESEHEKEIDGAMKTFDFSLDDKSKDDSHVSPSTAATIICVFVGLLVGAIVGNILCIIQTGRWRRKLGLTFIDWPRMVL
jgi:Ca2+/Na+ antiporter